MTYCQAIFIGAVLQVAMADWLVEETMFAMWRRVSRGGEVVGGVLQHRSCVDIYFGDACECDLNAFQKHCLILKRAAASLWGQQGQCIESGPTICKACVEWK